MLPFFRHRKPAESHVFAGLQCCSFTLLQWQRRALFGVTPWLWWVVTGVTEHTSNHNANCCLFTHPAYTKQHTNLFEIVSNYLQDEHTRLLLSLFWSPPTPEKRAGSSYQCIVLFHYAFSLLSDICLPAGSTKLKKTPSPNESEKGQVADNSQPQTQ